jgi:hypothetical protein
MRVSVLLSSLFAVTLLSSAALAEKPTRNPHDRTSHVREPREARMQRADLERIRSRVAGDQARPSAQKDRVNRVSCSDTGMDCGRSSRSNDSARGAGQKINAASRVVRDRDLKLPSQDRMACNEGGECSMSSKAVAKIWAIESLKAGTIKNKSADSAAERLAAAKARKARNSEDAR